MIQQLQIDDSFLSQELLQKMKQECAQIHDFAEFQYFPTPRQKTNQLAERVQQFVDEWRTSVDEQELSTREKSIYNMLLGASFNALPSYNELSTHFLTQAIRFNQHNFFAYYHLGIASTRARNFRRAELMFDTALRFAKPENLSYVYTAQSLLFRQIDTQDSALRALQCARDAVEQNPNNEKAWFSLGLSLLKASNLRENELAKAGHGLRKAIQIRDRQQRPFPDARFNYAMLCRLRYDFQQAYEQFRRSYEEDPSLSQANVRANEIEQLMSAAIARLQNKQLEINVFEDKERGIFGLQQGKNAGHQIQFRVICKFESQLPQFYVVQTLDGKHANKRCLFACNCVVRELEAGSVVGLRCCTVRRLQLRTKQAAYECWCICLGADGDGDADAARLVVNGAEVGLEGGGLVTSQIT